MRRSNVFIRASAAAPDNLDFLCALERNAPLKKGRFDDAIKLAFQRLLQLSYRIHRPPSMSIGRALLAKGQD